MKIGGYTKSGSYRVKTASEKIKPINLRAKNVKEFKLRIPKATAPKKGKSGKVVL